MAPLAASVALTVLATAAARVAVAAAMAERERRAARAARSRARHFGLVGDEQPGSGLQRMALGQLDLAIELLATNNGELSEAEAVHETRKALKRMRTLVRLVEDQLGEQSAAREHAVLRSTGRRLAGARDAEVAVGTLQALVRRYPALTRRPGVRRLQDRLTQERDRQARASFADQVARATALAELRTARERAAAWQLSDQTRIAAYEGPFERVYRKGRRRYRRAARGRRRERAALMHRWRKSVKDLRYAAEALSPGEPSAPPGARIVRLPQRRGKRARERRRQDRLARLARRADSLAERLGEEHDLVMLAELVRADELCGRRTRKAVLKAIKRRRKRLQKRSLRDGARLYRHRPRRLGRRLRAVHAARA